jgi:hypothetical protein
MASVVEAPPPDVFKVAIDYLFQAVNEIAAMVSLPLSLSLTLPLSHSSPYHDPRIIDQARCHLVRSTEENIHVIGESRHLD